MIRIKTLIFIIILTVSCNSKVTTEDDNSNEVNITKIEITSSEKESKKDERILQLINSFLEKESDPIVRNYWFLCDSSNIKPLREYDVNHKNENIQIHLGKKRVTINPIPGFYKVEEGPFAEFSINDDSLGKIHSYSIQVELSKNYEIIDFKGILSFSKRQKNGLNKVTFKKEILKGQNYLLAEKVKNRNW